MLRLHQNPGGFPLIGFEGFGIIFTVLGFVKEKICSKKIWHFFRRTASENLSCTTCHTLKQVKQNATNNLAPFPSQLLMPFQIVWSVLLTVLHLKTLLLIDCEFSTANQKPTNKWFLMVTQRKNGTHHLKEQKELSWKSGVRLFVPFCLT